MQCNVKSSANYEIMRWRSLTVLLAILLSLKKKTNSKHKIHYVFISYYLSYRLCWMLAAYQRQIYTLFTVLLCVNYVAFMSNWIEANNIFTRCENLHVCKYKIVSIVYVAISPPVYPNINSDMPMTWMPHHRCNQLQIWWIYRVSLLVELLW